MKADNILAELAGGSVLLSVRHFPLARKWVIRTADDPDTGREGKQIELTENTVAGLVNRGYVKPKPQDPEWDSIIYELTEKGRAQANTVPMKKGGR